MAARLAVLVLLVAAFPGCSALGLFDAMPATSCVRDEDCQVPGLVEDPCVRFTCNLTSRFCVGSLVDHDGDGQAPVGCASSRFAALGRATDCDDSDTFTYAGAVEVCSATDNDCDGAVDEDCLQPQLTTGALHNCYLAGPTLVCWGANLHGELGTGMPMEFGGHPRSVVGISDATSVVAGLDATCATVRDGRVFCWGSDEHGQLAVTGVARRLAPVEVPALEGASHLALGSSHGCALLAGDVVCWGRNEAGQLGDGTTDDRTVPFVVPGTHGALDVAAGAGASCAVLSDRTVTCWGTGAVRTGCGGSTTPCPVPGLTGVTEVAMGVGYACARRGAETAVCWGDDTYYQLGSVEAVAGGPGIHPIEFALAPDALSAGAFHACLLSGGHLWCWGNDTAHQLGLDVGATFQVSPVASQVSLDDLVDVGAGAAHTCVLRRTGDVLCWGLNDWGQLGAMADAFEVVRPLATWVSDGRP